MQAPSFRGYTEKDLAELVVEGLIQGGHTEAQTFWNSECWVVSAQVSPKTLVKYEKQALAVWRNTGPDGQPKTLAQVLEERGDL